MAKLYYLEQVKMSRLVKKYNISFSTITDILKKYDSNGDRIQPEGRPKPHPNTQEGNEEAEKSQQVKSDVKTEYIFPLLGIEMESPNNPEYVYYDN